MARAQPAFIARLREFEGLAEAEAGALAAALGDCVEAEGRTDLQLEGEEGAVAYAIEAGWAYAYKDLEDGRRQIVGFHFAGDTLGLRTLLLRTSDHAFRTLTPCRLHRLRRRDLEGLFADHPRLAAAVLWALARDEAIVVEHLVSLGRRSAEERLGHMLCELACRAASRGLAEAGAVRVPAPQTVLADALGLSVVHLNRTLRPMRERGLVEIEPTGLVVRDLGRLVEEAGFDPAFLGIYPDDPDHPDHML